MIILFTPLAVSAQPCPIRFFGNSAAPPMSCSLCGNSRLARVSLAAEWSASGGGKLQVELGETLRTEVGLEDSSRLFAWLGPSVTEKIHQRVVQVAHEQGVAQGRKLKTDSTVVESNIRYPTDSSLLGDSIRVFSRGLARIAAPCKKGAVKVVNHTRGEVPLARDQACGQEPESSP